MIAGVLVEITNKSVDKIFDYKIPIHLIEKIKVGMRVNIPFGNRTIAGFVIEIKQTSFNDKLKEIINVIDKEVILNEELLSLGKWLSKDTLSSLISCYQVMLPKALKAKINTKIGKKYETIYHYHKEINIPLTKSQQEIIKLFEQQKIISRKELEQSFSIARIKTLVKKKILEEEFIEEYRLTLTEEKLDYHALTKQQEESLKQIEESKNRVILLHGVTGSGKTEIYMELINHQLQKGKKSIVLVPEISLTPQLIKRFQKRFGTQIAILHSSLSEGEKYDEWRKIKKGEVNIVIGARSAIFAPLSNIGLIILDEEHSDSYKQDTTPRYNTKKVAIKRAEYHQAKVILGSATPTLESYARAKKGVYQLVELKERVNGRSLPKVELIDMSEAIKTSKGHFSKKMIEKIKEKLEKKEQVILLLNRRGYASILSCRNCGYVKKCPNCDITLTYHKISNMLRCHYCGYANKLLDICPNCKEKSLQTIGVGTEKIEEELKEILPLARVIRMDVDTTSKKGSHKKMIDAFANHEADILLGTQIVAKGLDFENVTLVGVINADTSLMIPDYRSSETTFDLLSQVAGRSGRSQKEGIVLLQTYNPNHYAMICAKNNDYNSFYKEEMGIRKIMKYPPFYYLVLINIASIKEEYALLEAKRCEKVLTKYLDKTIILGPSPATIFKKQNIYRYQLILKYQYQDNLNEILEKLQDYYKTNQKIKLEIDFYPLHI